MNIPAVVENASNITSLDQYLDTCELNIEGLTEIIAQNPSSINAVTNYGILSMTPLMKVLRNKKCTIDIIKLLLHHGADINYNDSRGQSPLTLALWSHADDKLIETLLDNGASVNADRLLYYSLLCTALTSRSSKHVFKLLLDKGCSLHSCRQHGSALHCFCSALCRGLREDILELLIKAGAKVSKLDTEGRSPMCVALNSGAGPQDVELLVQVGFSLNACKKHSSPFHCLTGDFEGNLVGNVVRTLLDAGVPVVENGSTLLLGVLRRCKYDTEAIRLLLNATGVDVNEADEFGERLLHYAVRGDFCRLGTVKLLLGKGAKVDTLNSMGDTALEAAIRSKTRWEVVKLLLKKGSPINRQGQITSKSLMLVVSSGDICAQLVTTLLRAGARIGMSQNLIRQPLSVWMRMRPKYEWNTLVYRSFPSNELNCIKYLLKCCFLECSEFNVEDLIEDHIVLVQMQDFVDKCKLELHRMGLEIIGHGRTLHQLISRNSSVLPITAGCMEEGKDFDINKLLETLSDNVFPVYFDIIAANVGKESMGKKLQEVPIYTVKLCPGSPRIDKKVTLIYDAVRIIARYLSDAELLRLILAFYNPKNHAGSKRGNEEQNVVVPGPSNYQKRPKLG